MVMIFTPLQRWAESEKLTPKPAPKKTKTPDLASPQILTPDPALCPSLPCFYIHSIYTILDPASQKFKSGSVPIYALIIKSKFAALNR